MTGAAIIGPFGPVAEAAGWTPSPRYILRRDRVLARLATLPPSRILEVGCATGSLLRELSARGHHCAGLESSVAARSLASTMHAGAVAIAEAPSPLWAERFDVLLALEVIEHIEDDKGAMTLWASWLKPGGLALISAPADPKRWNAADVWAGHYRRYRRQDLTALAQGAGLNVEGTETYGFPLANLSEAAKARSVARETADAGADDAARARATARSGVERSAEAKLYPHYARWPGRLAMLAAIAAQNLFLRVPFGNGHLIAARKPLRA